MSASHIAANRNSTPEGSSSLRPPQARSSLGANHHLRASADLGGFPSPLANRGIRPASEIYFGRNNTQSGNPDEMERAAQQWLADIDQYETTLEEMATATLDQDFKDELSAIEQWFRVLSEAERTAALYALLQQTTQVQIRFFIQVLQQMSKNVPMSGVLSPANFGEKDPMTQKLSDAMSKLSTGENRHSMGLGRPPPSPGAGKRNSGLETSQINRMFPDAAAAIAKQKAEFTDVVGVAPASNRNSTVGDRSSLAAPTISAPEDNKRENNAPPASPWNESANRPKSSGQQQHQQPPMGQFSQPPPSAGLRSPRLPLQNDSNNVQTTTLNALEANSSQPTMPQNKAAWITSPGAHPFVVKEAPYPSAGPGEVVIKNAAVAINPVEWKIQYHSEEHRYVYNYPFILGSDCAGTIEDVGEGVTRFAKGDRVIAFCPSLPTNNTAQSAFQHYTLVPATHTISIPASLPFKNGVVLPLALATAASGLYPPNLLNLPLPTTPPRKTELRKTVLIWGGSSSVGLAAIQFAVASGLRVIATCSPANLELVKSVGAKEVFDYRSASAVSDIVASLQQPDTEFAGVYDAISESSSFSKVKSIVETLQSKAPIAVVMPCAADMASEWYNPQFLMAFQILAPPHQHIGEYIFGEFLPEALEKGVMQAKPDAEVVGKGLESMQHGVDVLKKGVSAKKIVVEL